MPNANFTAITPKPESEIDSQLRNVRLTIEGLREQVTTLRDALSPVLSNSEQATKGQGVPRPVYDSPLGAALAELDDQATSVSGVLVDIASRIRC